MKKLSFAIALSILVITSSFAAGTTTVSSNAMTSFAMAFGNVKNVTWSVTDDYTKASFVENNKNVDAFFDKTGEMMATSSHVAIDDLPLFAKRAYAKKYAGYTVTDAIRFEGADETAYYIAVEDQTHSFVLKATPDGTLSIFKTLKK